MLLNVSIIRLFLSLTRHSIGQWIREETRKKGAASVLLQEILWSSWVGMLVWQSL